MEVSSFEVSKHLGQISNSVALIQEFLAEAPEIDNEDCFFVSHNYTDWLYACLLTNTQPRLCPFCLYPFPITNIEPPPEAYRGYTTDEDGGEIDDGLLPAL